MDLQTLLGPAFPYVEPVLGWVVGMDYPQNDGEQSVAGATDLRTAATKCRTAGGEGDETLNHVLAYAMGPAASALTAYWAKFTVDDPAYVEELAKSCESAAKRLEAYGLDTDYTQKYIALCLILLAFLLLRSYAFGPATGGASFLSIGPACSMARLNVKTIAKLLMMSVAFMVGLDGGTQLWQFAEGRRDEWDSDKTVAAVEGGLLTGLAFAGLGGIIAKLGGPRLLGGVVLKEEMTARERVAAFLTQTVGGVATQSSVASVIGSVPMLVENGQLTPEALGKAAVAGFVGGIDGRAGYAGPRAADGLHVPRLGEAPRLGESAPTGGTRLADARIPGEAPRPADQRVPAYHFGADPHDGAGGPSHYSAGGPLHNGASGRPHEGASGRPHESAGGQPRDGAGGSPHERTGGGEPGGGARGTDGRAAPELTPRHRELIRQSRHEVAAGVWYRDPDRAVMPSADMRLLRQTPGIIDVGIRTDRNGFHIGDQRLSSHDVGTMLANDPVVLADPGAKLRILGCDIGQDLVAMRQLADITGREVIAADKFVYIGADRLAHTGSIPQYRQDGRPIFREDGQWHHTQPEQPHQQPTVPMDVARPSHELPPGPLNEETLKAKLEREQPRIKVVGDGQHGIVQEVRFRDGTLLIRKLHNFGHVTVAKDLLASLVGRAIGAPVPHIIRDPANRDAVYMQFMDGVDPSQLKGSVYPFRSGASGRLLGLLDALVANTDRRGGNWLAHGKDGVHGIDLSRSFTFGLPKDEYTVNDFSEHYMDAEGDWIDNQLTRQDIELFTQRIEALRPEFEKLGREAWHDQVLDNLYQIGDHATGDVPLSHEPVHHFGDSYSDYPAAFDRVHDQAQAIFQTRWRVGDVVPYLARGGGSERTFGVELEYSLPHVPPEQHARVNAQIARALHEAGLSAETGVLAHHTGHERGYGEARDGWWVELERTASVAGEVVSPILRDTPETWHRVAQVVEIIRAHGGEAGPGVGGHIHVGTPDYREVVNYLKLLDSVRGHQDILFRLAQNPVAEGALHRGYDSCIPNIARPGLRPYHFQALIDANGPISAVSMESVRGRANDHVQFRLWDGSLETGVIQAQARLSLALADGALTGDGVGHPPEVVGHHREHGDDSESFRRMLDELPLHDLDKEQLISLYAITGWQPSVLERYSQGGARRP
ncbi:hypothetical protein [Nonomuraea sp. NEAU-A123]|uniref:WXG100-like domain-containing protein n=1 Tax=Nonomuraea sp. NEAU-A123 TaxID=2839649 RepID=UPI001BE4D229|nr:hypothetical protein [Nonomuraea sp. NEAU-A123]MBT2232002.1 hypothetical protein [Nonomuraea sp. NEAU-A123]